MEERLQKLIAAAGIASRRHAEELITAGAVSVNGAIVTELGTKADLKRDQIIVNGKSLNALLEEKRKVYVLLNKPKGYLTSVSDPEGRRLVVDLLPPELGRLHPVGRLDYNTEGLLLLTNDGAFTHLVTAAKNGIAKVYEVKVKGVPPVFALERLRRGIVLEDGVRTAPAEIVARKQTDANAWFRVTLYEGRNQQIRRMFDAIGHSVLKLRRVSIGPLNEENIPVGAWRYLAPFEVTRFTRTHRPAPAPNRKPLEKSPTARKKSPPATQRPTARPPRARSRKP